MGTLSEYQQRLLDCKSGEEMDRAVERKRKETDYNLSMFLTGFIGCTDEIANLLVAAIRRGDVPYLNIKEG